jgi:hypothetical protein
LKRYVPPRLSVAVPVITVPSVSWTRPCASRLEYARILAVPVPLTESVGGRSAHWPAGIREADGLYGHIRNRRRSASREGDTHDRSHSNREEPGHRALPSGRLIASRTAPLFVAAVSIRRTSGKVNRGVCLARFPALAGDEGP